MSGEDESGEYDSEGEAESGEEDDVESRERVDSIQEEAKMKKQKPSILESSEDNEPSEEDYDSEDESSGDESEDSFEAKYGEKRIQVLSEKQPGQKKRKH